MEQKLIEKMTTFVRHNLDFFLSLEEASEFIGMHKKAKHLRKKIWLEWAHYKRIQIYDPEGDNPIILLSDLIEFATSAPVTVTRKFIEGQWRYNLDKIQEASK